MSERKLVKRASIFSESCESTYLMSKSNRDLLNLWMVSITCISGIWLPFGSYIKFEISGNNLSCLKLMLAILIFVFYGNTRYALPVKKKYQRCSYLILPFLCEY